MTKLLRIQKPKFVEEFDEKIDVKNEFLYSDRVKNIIAQNDTLVNKCEVGFEIDSCKFTNIDFKGCSFERLDLIDVIFENCDFSNVSLIGSSIHRTEFINCKFVGTRFDESHFKNVLFEKSLGKYANFSYTKMENINIVETDISEAVFQEVKLNKVVFHECNMCDSFFDRTFLGKVDFTTCNINGISARIEDLRGVTVNSFQALDLTRLMGLNIK
ncbi:MAG: pentapeptide repeat-containing protein [Clostridium sp.]|nr:pentapeptide repeat-containing protein [Clostridium sp.]